MTDILVTATGAPTDIGSFFVSLNQAILRTGYFSPDNPKLPSAREGLYESFMSVVGPGGELHFFISGEGEDRTMCTETPGQPPAMFNEIMAPNLAGINSDELVRLLEGKGLLSLTINSTIGLEEFSSFVELMGDPHAPDGDRELIRDLFLAGFDEHKIRNISLILEDDLVTSSRKVSWRAKLALSKLTGDLKTLSISETSEALQLQGKMRACLHDVVRSLVETEQIYSLLMNLDLAMPDAEGVEILEDELFSSLDDRLFIEMASLLLKDATGKDIRYKDDLPTEKFTQLLIKTSDRLIEIDRQEAGERLQEIFESDLLPLDKTPTPVRERITKIRLVKSFLGYSQKYLDHLELAADSNDYARSAMPLAVIVPFLLDGGKYHETVSIASMLFAHSREDSHRTRMARKALKTIGESGSLEKAAEVFLAESKENRIEAGKFLKYFGASSVKPLLDIVNRTRDIWRIKHASELLLEMGHDSASALVTAVKGRKVSKHATATVIRVLCGIDHDKLKERAAAAIESMVNDKDEEVRREALHALAQLAPIGRFEVFRKGCLDPADAVKKEAVRGLGVAGNPSALKLLADLIDNAQVQPADDKWDLASSAVLALGYLFESAADNQTKTAEYLLELAKKGYPGGKIKRMFKSLTVFPTQVLISLVYSLGRMGGEGAANALKEMSKSRDETVSKRASVELEKLGRN